VGKKSARKMAAEATRQLVASLPPGMVTKAVGGTPMVPLALFEEVLEETAFQLIEASQKVASQARRGMKDGLEVSRKAVKLAEERTAEADYYRQEAESAAMLMRAAWRGQRPPGPASASLPGLQPFDPAAYKLGLLASSPPPGRNGHDLNLPGHPQSPPPPEAL